ncbi:hypothetical protein JOB18_007952 [Solea senegalensis]|nr:tumor necrosis factor receptor superfamily member 6 [Solea senegalensis]KAG7474389.1 CD27 antigen [Solea senegalensis]KAG7474391.1 hypothetical protein JOB18_007952 [Solea senegalensis]
MQRLCYVAFSLLCSLPSIHSLQCSETEYAWPVEEATFCCKKCEPGKYMDWRQEASCEIKCDFCKEGLYRDSYNVDMNCNLCKSCKKTNMEYKSHCNATHNAVCRCKAGYKCRDQQCTQCLPIPTTTTLPPSTTASTLQAPTTLVPPKPIRDQTVWFLVITALLCTGIALVVVAKIKPLLRWIRSRRGYFLTEKPVPVPSCSEEDVVSKPVQEVCGKCDQPIDLCSDDKC